MNGGPYPDNDAKAADIPDSTLTNHQLNALLGQQARRAREHDRYFARDCGQWKCYIRIRFNVWQRLRILLGQAVFVYFHSGTPPAHVSYVAPKNWHPDN